MADIRAVLNPLNAELKPICLLLALFGAHHILHVSQWRAQEFCSGGGVQQIQLRTERTGMWGRYPLVRGSGSSCNLVQEISFHVVKFS